MPNEIRWTRCFIENFPAESYEFFIGLNEYGWFPFKAVRLQFTLKFW